MAYGSPERGHSLIGDFFWKNFHKRRIEKRINAKVLFHTSLDKWGKELNKYNLTTVRFTDKNFEELTETIICGKRVAIIVYLEKPFGFLIEEQNAANSYKRFFELIWKIS